jgi:uncharacterized membrane protein
MSQREPTPNLTDGDPIRENVEAVAKLEQDFDRKRSVSERIADAIANFSGSLSFVVIHIVIFGLWILINAGGIPFIPRFDPFPFMLLAMSVSMEAIFLSTFVLIKQNRMSRRADQRAHLDLQINLLAEREMTLVVRMLQDISSRLGVRVSGGDVRELAKETSVQELVNEMENKLPE